MKSVKLPVRACFYVKDDNKALSNHSGHLIENSTTHAALFIRDKDVVSHPMTQVSRIEVTAPVFDIK